jgi:hypothetical protein
VTTRQVGLYGAAVGLIISSGILTALAFGVSGALTVHEIDLRCVLWPSWMMLTVGWRTTTSGIAITVLAVVINCLIYLGIAILLRLSIRSVAGLIRHYSAK